MPRGVMPKPILIGGPTASGKSELALRLAEHLGGVVINADAMQVYAELEILTARPGAADLARAPHWLYGHRSGRDPGSMADWVAEAHREIAASQAEGLVPILVGGTGLYLRALAEGFSNIPPVPTDIRQAIAHRRDQEGPKTFFTWLAANDPHSAKTLTAGDTQRVLRAAEVLEATGQPLSYWQNGPDAHPGLPSFDRVTLIPPRELLYTTCDARFEKMLDLGALEEVRRFASLGLPRNLPVNKALGLPELRAHLAGEMTLEQAVAATQQATRNYAKRQLTWFRNQVKPDQTAPARRDLRLDAQYSESFLEKIVPFVQKDR